MMKKLLTLLLVIAMILSLMSCRKNEMQDNTEENTQINTNVGSADENMEVNMDVAITDFSVRLFRENACQLEAPGTSSENVLISPTSIMMALAMTANGAKGETLTQMEDAFGLSAEELSNYMGNYIQQLSENENTKLDMANSIWFTDEESFAIKNEFLQTNESYFGEENYDAFRVPFNDETLEDINGWVNDKTDGTIPSILDKIPENAVMYLINALAFEAEWEEIYDQTQIREGTFYLYDHVEQQVNMMYSEENLYLKDENATGFIKYYEGRDYAFVALLPNKNTNIYEYINDLDGAHLQEMLSNPTEVHVDAWIPQFQVEYKEPEMEKLLMEMGVIDLFDGQRADLTGIGTSDMGNIRVSHVVHKTFLELTPVGTKAGAATAVEMRYESAPLIEETKEVRLNRPFIYMIIDCENNQPIFMGTVCCVSAYRCGVEDLCGYPLK